MEQQEQQQRLLIPPVLGGNLVQWLMLLHIDDLVKSVQGCATTESAIDELHLAGWVHYGLSDVVRACCGCGATCT